jgi:hypothetical protein
LSGDGSLVIIGVADAKDAVADLRDRWVGAGGGEHGDALLLTDFSASERARGGDFAEDGDDFVAADEFLDGGVGLGGFGLIVLGNNLDLFAQDPLGVDLFEGQEEAFVGAGPEDGGVAGEGGIFADDDFVGIASTSTPFGFILAAGRKARQKGQRKQKQEFFHAESTKWFPSGSGAEFIVKMWIAQGNRAHLSG